MKFGARTQTLIPRTVTWQTLEILLIQNGGRPPYWKSFYGYISTTNCPLYAKFGTKKHVRLQVTWQITKFRKFKMADGYFENVCIAISQPGIIRFLWCLVCGHKCWFEELSRDKVSKFWQIQNGWRSPYWKSLLAIFQRFIVRLTRNLVWRSRITLRHRSHCQNTRPSFCLWVIMSASLVRAHIFHVDCFTRIRQRYVPNPVEILNLVRHMYVTRTLTRTLTLS